MGPQPPGADSSAVVIGGSSASNGAGAALHEVPRSVGCTLGKSTTYARRSCALFSIVSSCLMGYGEREALSCLLRRTRSQGRKRVGCRPRTTGAAIGPAKRYVQIGRASCRERM